MLIAVPSCDKDSNTDDPSNVEPQDPPVVNPDPTDPQNLSEIEKATLGKKVLVDELADANTITWLKTAKFDAFAAKVAEFSNKAAVAIGIDGDDNIAVSPLSVFMALAMSADCANGDTRQELLDALGVTIDDLRTMNMRSLCYLMNRTLEEPVYYNDASSTDPYSTSPDKAKNFIKCVNSLWVRGDVQVKEDELKELNNAYFSDVMSMDFANTDVNELVTSYISSETNGLLKPTFDLDENTAILLMNVLYLRDIWSEFGSDLDLTDQPYDFVNYDRSTLSTQLLKGYYHSGKAVETEKFRKFYNTTNSGLSMTFFVPKDGYTLDDIYTSDVLNDPTPYVTVDTTSNPEVNYRFHTRCFFPEFEASFDDDIKDVIHKMGVNKFFTRGGCDFSNLTDEGVFCSQIRHITKLEVARKGIEGAAVTIVEMAEKASGGPYEDEWEDVLEDFIVDRNFAYVLSMDGVPVFTGVVKTIK
jgi:serpin B